MSYEYFYPGTPYSLEPVYGDVFTGYRAAGAELGMSTDPRTANQIQEISNKLSMGVKTMEMSAIQPDVFESIPQQHLKEINRLSQLTGVDITMHGPIVEASGYTKQGGWDEASRKQSENQMNSAVERSHEISPKGNIPVTFHSTAMLPSAEEKMKEKVEGEMQEVSKSMLIADPRTGEIKEIKKMEKFFPGEILEGGKQKPFDPEAELKRTNEELWLRTLNNLNFHAMRGEEAVTSGFNIIKGRERKEGKITDEEILKLYAEKDRDEAIKEIPEEFGVAKDAVKTAFRQFDHGDIFLRDSYNMLKEYYNMVYKDAKDNDKKVLDEYANEIKPLVLDKNIDKDPLKMRQFAEIIEKGVRVLKNIESPEVYVPLNNFLIDKSSETFSNVALNSYKKFGDKSPIITIENPPYGGALSRAEEIKKLIEESRKKFVEKAVNEGMSKSGAEDAAKKLIGATWDVGHINMMRKYGYDKADLIKQAEIIAPFAKHVHLSDNFGYEHTELPMGMGNVPIKEILGRLGEEGFSGKKIIEAGNWFQHFKTPPFTQTLEAFGSPLYQMKAPYWNQIASTYGNYFAFPSAYFPEQHFSLYGGGFSTLPQELGGQIPGKESRATGTPMA